MDYNLISTEHRFNQFTLQINSNTIAFKLFPQTVTKFVRQNYCQTSLFPQRVQQFKTDKCHNFFSPTATRQVTHFQKQIITIKSFCQSFNAGTPEMV